MKIGKRISQRVRVWNLLKRNELKRSKHDLKPSKTTKNNLYKNLIRLRFSKAGLREGLSSCPIKNLKTRPMTQTLKPDAYNLDLEPLGPCNSEPLKKSNSSRSQMFFEISSIKNFGIFTGNLLCWDLFLIKLQAFTPQHF